MADDKGFDTIDFGSLGQEQPPTETTTEDTPPVIEDQTEKVEEAPKDKIEEPTAETETAEEGSFEDKILKAMSSENTEDIDEENKEVDDTASETTDTVAETIVPDSSLKVEEETPQFDINKFISDKTSGKFNDIDSLVASATKDESSIFANERIQKLNELAKQGVDVDEVIKFNALGIESMEDPETIIRTQMKLEDPDATDREINLLIKSKYGINEDEMDDDQIELKKVSLIKDARKAKKELLQQKKKLELPTASPTQEVDNTKNQELIAQQQKQIENWKNQVKDLVRDYKTEKISLDGTEELNFTVTPEMNSEVSEYLQNPATFWQSFKDLEEMRTAMFFAKNHKAAIKASAGQLKSVIEEQVLRTLQNARKKGTISAPPKVKEKSAEDSLFDQLGGRRF